MDAVIVRLLESVARPIALALFHSLWQGAIIFGLVAAALVALRKRSATVRYGVACVGLLLMLVVLVSTAVYFVAHPEPALEQEVVMTRAADLDAAAAGSAANEAGSPTVPEQTGPGRGAWILPDIDMEFAGPWIFFAWFAGVVLLAGAHLNGWRRARLLSRVGVSSVPPEWTRRLKRLCEHLGLSASVRFLASTRVTVPTVVGCLRPVILVPLASFTELAAGDLELVIIHELAHVRRHDVLIGYAQAAAETLLFYHPAVWWISRRVRIEREHCCDDGAVRATGDSVAYARALSEVEHMRQRIPAHTMAADGGAFRDRIRRLVGGEPSGASTRRAGLAGVLVLTLVFGLAVPSITAAPVGDANAQTASLISSTYNDVEGEWRAKGFGGTVQMHFDLDDWGEMTMTMDSDDLVESGDGYRLQKDAGTFVLEGSRMPRKWRKVVFRPDPAFATALVNMGYDVENSEQLMELAVHEVSLDLARGIADAGYDVPLDTLVAFQIHDVTPDYVRAMADAGYDELTPDKIVAFAIHDIDPDYVKRMATAGYEDMTPDGMIAFAIHDIEAEYVERMAAVGYEDLTPDRLIEFAIHDIEPEYVERMAAVGYEDLTPNRIIEFAIHDIDAEYVEEMAALGYEHMDPSRIIEFHIHGVDADFISGLAEVGYGDIGPSRIVEFAIHDVTPQFIERLEKKGITGLSPSELVEYRITGGSRHGSRGHRGSL
ncbi:MAG TPA: M56 family metallopeptidase [bacterium]|nr:M56 family metallopeptidase [bacterium]